MIPEILIVEDNPDHLEMIRMALTGSNTASHIYAVTNGEEALDYLYCRGTYSGMTMPPAPSFILLDIRLPRMDGFEVLRTIKNDEHLKLTPVILLTTSSEKNEILMGYECGANSYVTKPLRFDEFMDCIKGIYTYWLFTNMLPGTEGSNFAF